MNFSKFEYFQIGTLLRFDNSNFCNFYLEFAGTKMLSDLNIFKNFQIGQKIHSLNYFLETMIDYQKAFIKKNVQNF